MLSKRLKNKVIEWAIAHKNVVDHNFKHFTFIIRRNKIICFGFNQPYKSHPIACKHGHRFNSIHAELHAICNFPYPVRELRKYTMVNVRISKDERLRISKPCRYCIPLIAGVSPRRIYYSTDSGDFVEL